MRLLRQILRERERSANPPPLPHRGETLQVQRLRQPIHHPGQPQSSFSPAPRKIPPRPDEPPPRPSTPGLSSPPGGEADPALERRLLRHLADVALSLPTDALAICRAISTPEAPVTPRGVESLLEKFAAQELIEVRRGLLQDGPSPQATVVTYADHSKLSAMTGAVGESGGDGGLAPLKDSGGRKRRGEQEGGGASNMAAGGGGGGGGGEAGKEAAKKWRKQASDVDLEIESLLSQQSTKEQQSKKVGADFYQYIEFLGDF
uniref:Uncharacterized protein n=1 Tax=Calidris pygmaea TaxID=425635 RepID=A0A8C3JM28_9CHAR